ELDGPLRRIRALDREEVQRLADLPFVRAAHPRRPVYNVAGTNLVIVAFDVAHDRAPGDDIVKRLDQVEVQMLVGAGGQDGEVHVDALARVLGRACQLFQRDAFDDAWRGR